MKTTMELCKEAEYPLMSFEGVTYVSPELERLVALVRADERAASDLQAELDATNRQVEILSDALAESRREVAALKAVQEPFGYFRYDMRLDAWVQSRNSNQGTAFYTTPPAAQRQWVDLTDEERNDCLVEADPCECLATPEAQELMCVVEAKLRSKNI
jgi:hypothetical protein